MEQNFNNSSNSPTNFNQQQNLINKEINMKNHITEENVDDFDDSISNGEEIVKDLSPVGGIVAAGTCLKRKNYDDVDVGTNKTNYDYMKNFDGIRARSFEEIQNDELKHQRMMTGSQEYRIEESNKTIDESCGTNNYASSEDLNQTNSSEQGEKITSGSDDEGGLFFLNFSFF